MQYRGCQRVSGIRVRRYELRQSGGLRVAGLDDDGARARSGKAVAISGIGQEGDGSLARGVERSDTVDDDIAVAGQLGAAALGELAQRDPDSVW